MESSLKAAPATAVRVLETHPWQTFLEVLTLAGVLVFANNTLVGGA